MFRHSTSQLASLSAPLRIFPLRGVFLMLPLLLASLLASPAWSLEVDAYSAVSNDLYADWDTPQQALNTGNVASSSSIDVSGVGWGEIGGTGDRHSALVSNFHVMQAHHYLWSGPIYFFSPSLNEIVTYYLAADFDERITAANGIATDIVVRRIYRDPGLTLSGLDPAHGLMVYDIAANVIPNQVIYPIGFGASGGTNSFRVGIDSVDNLALDPVLDTDVYGWIASGTPNEAFVVSGDSGSPTLTYQAGSTVLAGIHVARGSLPIAGGGVSPVSIDADLAQYSAAIADAVLPKAEIEIRGNGLPIASGDSSPNLLDGTDFVVASIGGSATQSFSIANAGLATLSISSIILPGNSDFTVVNIPQNIAAGQSAIFQVIFTPSSTNLVEAIVMVASNGADVPVYMFTIQGRGLGPIAQWRLAKFGDSSNSGTGANLGDPDGDGLLNLYEYAFDLDPFTSDTLHRIQMSTNLAGYVQMSFDRYPSRSDLEYVVEVADEIMAVWMPIANSFAGAPTVPSIASSVAESPSGSAMTVIVADAVPWSTYVRRFMRVAVTLVE